MYVYIYIYPPTPAAQGGARKGKGVSDTAARSQQPVGTTTAASSRQPAASS